MARKYWPGENPIGKRVALDFETMRFRRDGPPRMTWDIPGGMREIVGVVADVKHARLDTESVPEMYIPAQQRPTREMSVVVRTQSEPLALAAVVRRELAALDSQQPLSNLNTMSRLLAVSVAQPRFNFLALALFAALALLLATVGIYGVMAYAATQRTHEVGIRMALGAQTRDVLKLIVGNGMRLALIGLVVGIAGAFALTRLMTTLLYEVKPTDPATFAGATLLLALVALLACWLPARRAAKVDPMEALRYE
jgi:putative ABC transport system permease protein